jgi:membrane dipeptidase
MFVVDAHLDLAYNALRGRNVLLPATEQAADPEGIPTVGLPDLRGGSVGFVCATIFAEPALRGDTGYRTPDEAQVAGWNQLSWYLEQFKRGEIDLVTSPDEVPTGPCGDGSPHGRAVPAVLLLEGADPLREPSDLGMWFDAGLRIIGMAWKQTRYAGGTGAPGPLTDLGRRLAREMDRLGVIHDVSHLAEASFWELMDLATGPVIASHSNCRAFVPTDRQLSDDMIRALAARGAVIGINYFDKFLVPVEELKSRRATLADVVRHIDHICQLAGSAAHVGIGTDMDGGLGRDNIPVEMHTSADLPKLAESLSTAGYSDADVAGIMGRNFAGFFRRHLPTRARSVSI